MSPTAPFTLLCDAKALRERLAGPPPHPCIVDASFDLADPAAGDRQYAAERLPGAFRAHLDLHLSAPKPAQGRDPRGRHPLPERAAFARWVATLGIVPGRQVVVYDRQGSTYAARLWWMLRWLGHEAVAVLDGGLPAWIAAGGQLERGAPTSRPDAAAAGRYPEAEPLVRTIDADALVSQLGRVRLIDARAPERFRGEVEPLDPVAGHIPGATNRFFQANLAPDGCFKPAEQLRREFAPWVSDADGAVAGEVIHQCGSGVTACHNLLAQELAGLGRGTLYPGSWSEWCADPRRPVAVG